MTGLLFWIRVSGAHIFKNSLDVRDSDLKLLSVLGRSGPKTSLQLAAALGAGKTQISRTTTALMGRGLIVRNGNRASFALTADGEAIFSQLKTIAAERREVITRGVAADSLREIVAAVTVMTKTVEQLHAAELNGVVQPPVDDSGEVAAAVDMIGQDAFIPLCVTLSLLMKRLVAARWKRIANITFFDWMVLARVAEAGHLEQSDLARQTGRDKSQIWRTVAGLATRGLLTRQKLPDRRNVQLMVTPEGRAVYERIARDCFEMDDLIMRSLSDDRRALILTSIDLMTRNAQTLLPRGAAGPMFGA